MLLLSACSQQEKENAYVQKTFLLSVPAQVKVYGANQTQGKEIADAIFNEWNRISDEFNYDDKYSMTSLVNKKAFGEWVKVDDEFLDLLSLAIKYTELTDGSFDITFAPLWPLWRDAASSKKMPNKNDIKRALKNIGARNIEIDRAAKSVRFLKPIQINMGGLLRGYCFERAHKLLSKMNVTYPVELKLGGNMMGYGGTGWEYKVSNPMTQKEMGRFVFKKGAVISSSGRDGFVEIDGELYSHILDLKTGYPIKNFSSLTVYFSDFGDENYLSSAALAVMGKDKAFSVLEAMKGTAAVWVDGSGEPSFFINKNSQAKWEENTGVLEFLK